MNEMMCGLYVIDNFCYEKRRIYQTYLVQWIVLRDDYLKEFIQ